MLTFLVAKNWGWLSDMSKAPTKLNNTSKTLAAIRVGGNTDYGRWVDAKVAQQCVRALHRSACPQAPMPLSCQGIPLPHSQSLSYT